MTPLLALLDAAIPAVVRLPSIATLLCALIPTIVMELCVLLFLRERRRRVLFGSVVINCATNIPLSTWAVMTYPTWSAIFVAELLVFLIEAGLYRLLGCRPRQALAYSFLCNSISFLVGLVVELTCIVLDIDMPLLY